VEIEIPVQTFGNYFVLHSKYLHPSTLIIPKLGHKTTIRDGKTYLVFPINMKIERLYVKDVADLFVLQGTSEYANTYAVKVPDARDFFENEIIAELEVSVDSDIPCFLYIRSIYPWSVYLLFTAGPYPQKYIKISMKIYTYDIKEDSIMKNIHNIYYDYSIYGEKEVKCELMDIEYTKMSITV